MIRHTRDVTIVALTRWMMSNQDDPGCRQAANALGDLGARAALLEMLDGSITPRCAAAVANGLVLCNAEDFHLLPDLYRLADQYSAVVDLLNETIGLIEADDDECTCRDCGAPLEEDEGLASRGTIRPMTPPDDQHLRN